MAGDWIKLEHATPRKPEVSTMAEMLGVSLREMMGILVDYLFWIDVNARHENVTLMSRKSLDAVLQCDGLSACLEFVGWIKWDDEGRSMSISNFGRHNGESAKNRVLASDRKRNQRAKDVTPMSQKSVTREEKRINPIVPSKQSAKHRSEQHSEQCSDCVSEPFSRFWTVWPKSERKANRRGCLEKWRKDGLDAVADQIIAHVEAMAGSKQWQDGYDPLPMTYLNQRRWEDGSMPAGKNGRKDDKAWLV